MILVDTGPLVALCNPRDSLHGRAATEFPSLIRHEFSICEPVLVETCFHLRHPIQRRRLQEIIEQFDVHSAGVADVHAFHLDVFEWLAKYANHEPDWADGCIAVLCGYHDRLKVWTYDREFKTTWRRPDGSSIPLAIKL